jgi:hypothetical protein
VDSERRDPLAAHLVAQPGCAGAQSRQGEAVGALVTTSPGAASATAGTAWPSPQPLFEVIPGSRNSLWLALPSRSAATMVSATGPRTFALKPFEPAGADQHGVESGCTKQASLVSEPISLGK